LTNARGGQHERVYLRFAERENEASFLSCKLFLEIGGELIRYAVGKDETSLAHVSIPPDAVHVSVPHQSIFARRWNRGNNSALLGALPLFRGGINAADL
jgi:hypothetical protein